MITFLLITEELSSTYRPGLNQNIIKILELSLWSQYLQINQGELVNGKLQKKKKEEDNSFNNKLDIEPNNYLLRQEQKEDEYINNRPLNFDLNDKSKEKIRLQLLLDYLQVTHQQLHHLQQLELPELLHDKDDEPTKLLKVSHKQYLLDYHRNELLHK